MFGRVTRSSVYLSITRFSRVIAKSEAVITPPGQVPTSEFVRSPAPVIAEAVKVRVGRVCTRTVSPRCLSSPSYARFVCARNTVSRSRLRITSFEKIAGVIIVFAKIV